MFQKTSTYIRHKRLARIARNLVFDALRVSTRKAYDVTPEQVTALAFTRHKMTVDTSEAQLHINGALVAAGLDLSPATA